jgi:hypothetical protein
MINGVLLSKFLVNDETLLFFEEAPNFIVFSSMNE